MSGIDGFVYGLRHPTQLKIKLISHAGISHRVKMYLRAGPGVSPKHFGGIVCVADVLEYKSACIISISRLFFFKSEIQVHEPFVSNAAFYHIYN